MTKPPDRSLLSFCFAAFATFTILSGCGPGDGGSLGVAPGGSGGAAGHPHAGGSGPAAGGAAGEGGRADAPDAAEDAGPDDDATVTVDADEADTADDAGPGAMAGACLRTVEINDSAGLEAAVGGALPGDCLIVADGEYLPPLQPIAARGTAAAPILLRAANRGKASFRGGSRVSDEVDTGGLRVQGAAFVIIEGFAFPGYAPVNLVDASHCRITRCRFEEGAARATGKSDQTEIDHNDFGPKTTPGHAAQATGLSTNTYLHHNLFHDFAAGAGHDPVSLGCCGTTFDRHETGNVFEYNLLVSCLGTGELVSVRSSANTLRHNTVRGSTSPITLHSGHKNAIYGNFILGGVGLRMNEDDHRIYNNYVEAMPALEVPDAGARRAIVVHNTFLGAVSLAGSDNVFANNIVTGDTNLGSAASAGNLTSTAAAGLVKVGEVFLLTAKSKAVNAAVGSYPFVVDDIQGQPRMKPDVGADEWSDTVVREHLLTTVDVGPDAP